MPATISERTAVLGRTLERQTPFDHLALALTLLLTLAPGLTLAAITLFSVDVATWKTAVLPSGRRLILLGNSLGLAGATAVIATIIGGIGALFLWLLPIHFPRLKTAITWLLVSLIAMPPAIHALAWLAVSGRLAAARLPFGWLAAIWVGVATFAPLAAGFGWLGLRAITPDIIAAGRVYRSDWHTITRIALPLAAPSLLTGGGIIFLFSLLDYSVPSLFQVNVYALEVFAEFSAGHSPAQAFLSALPLLLAGIALLIGLLRPLPHALSRPAADRHVWEVPAQLDGPVAGMGRFVAGILLAQIMIPFAALIWMAGQGAGGSAVWRDTLQQAAPEIGYSLQTAVGAALLSLILAGSAARRLLRASAGQNWLWLGILWPISMPAPLLGIGWLVIAGHWPPPFRALLPVLTLTSRFLPLAVMIMLAWLRRTDPLLFDAALVFQPSSFQRWRQVYFPLLLPGGALAAGCVMALSLGELGATLMVAPPGSATITLRLYNYLHYGASDTVAALGLTLAAIIFLAGGLVIGVTQRGGDK